MDSAPLRLPQRPGRREVGEVCTPPPPRYSTIRLFRSAPGGARSHLGSGPGCATRRPLTPLCLWVSAELG